MFLLGTKLPRVKRYGYLLAILLTFEVIEFFAYTNLTGLFIPELQVDVVWDLIIGMLGGVIVDVFRKE